MVELAVLRRLEAEESDEFFNSNASQTDSFFSTDSGCYLTQESPRRPARVKNPPVNANRISQYHWLEEVLRAVVVGQARDMVVDVASRSAGSPLFVLAGACPSSLTRAMQAMMFSVVGEALAVDYWWIKPSASDPRALERGTLDRHFQGRHKNTCGKMARAIYAAIADKFVTCRGGGGGTSGGGSDLAFDLDHERRRAFIEERFKDGHRARLYLFFVWQETWSGPWAYRKFMQGQLCYQRMESSTRLSGASPEANGSTGLVRDRFYVRQFKIWDNRILMSPPEDELEVRTCLPPDWVQEMYDMPETF